MNSKKTRNLQYANITVLADSFRLQMEFKYPTNLEFRSWACIWDLTVPEIRSCSNNWTILSSIQICWINHCDLCNGRFSFVLEVFGLLLPKWVKWSVMTLKGMVYLLISNDSTCQFYYKVKTWFRLYKKNGRGVTFTTWTLVLYSD